MGNDKAQTIKYTSHNSIYGLGVIGALIYFIQHATSFWMGLVGIVEAIFWPAVVLYKVLELLKL
jgi:hypothetical protein